MNKIFTWSNYKHCHLYLSWPSDGYENYRVQLMIGFWRMFISIPLWKTSPWTQWSNDAPRYGIGYHDAIFWIYHGAGKWKAIDMPWQWEIVRHDLLFPNGMLFHRNHYPRIRLGEKTDSKHWYEVFEKPMSDDIKYNFCREIQIEHHTKYGRKQVANLRMCGEEREWRWKWFKWLPFPNQVQRVIDCESDVELGERAGSWKGGMIGWSIPWNKGEEFEYAFKKWYKKWDGQ